MLGLAIRCEIDRARKVLGSLQIEIGSGKGKVEQKVTFIAAESSFSNIAGYGSFQSRGG
jgi:hypothetical protein